MKKIGIIAMDFKTEKLLNEVFNKINVNIDFTLVDKNSLCIVFTSCLPSEGKTILSANTAIAMAASGKKTLLIDADMRKPNCHKFFKTSNTCGLSNFIAGDADWRQNIIEPGYPNLYLITAGYIPPNPCFLLGSQSMKTLMTQLKSEFDRIVFDSPPILAVPDIQVISSHVDGFILVVRSTSTTTDDLKKAYNVLKLSGSKVLGAILNDVKISGRNYEYGYAYYGGVDEREAKKRVKKRR